MEHDELRKPDDSLFEDVSVVTALGVSGAALFFRNGNGRDLANIALKSKIYLDKYSQVIQDHVDDITELNMDMFDKAHNEAKREYNRLKDIGNTFYASDTKAVRALSEFYKAELNPNGVLRDFYTSDLRKVALESINNIENLPENIKSTLMSNLGTFALSYNDPDKIFQEMQKRLGSKNFTNSIPLVNKIREDVASWAEENDFKNKWYTDKGNTLIKELKGKLFNLDDILEAQKNEDNKLTSKFANVINPDKALTFGDILDIDARDSDDYQRKQIRKWFDSNRMAILGTEHGEILDEVNKIPDLKNKLKYAKIDSEKNINLTSLDLIRLFYNQASDEDKEKFRSIKINGLMRDNQGNIYSSSEYRKVGGKLADFISEIFPFSMTRLRDVRYQQKAGVYSHIFKSGVRDAVLAYAQGLKDFTGNTIIVVGDKAYEEIDGHIVENKKLRNVQTYSSETGIIKEVTQAQNEALAYESDANKNLLERKTGISFAIKDITETHGNNVRLFASFNNEVVNEMIDLATNGKIEDYYEFKNRAARFQPFLDRTTYGFNSSQAKKLAETLDADDELRKYLDYIVRIDKSSEDFENVMSELLKIGDSNITYMNPELSKALKQYARNDEQFTRSFIKTKKDPMARKVGDYLSLSFKEEIQQQLGKEFAARFQQRNGYKELTELIEKTFTGDERKKATSFIAVRKYLEDIGLSLPESTDDTAEDGAAKLISNIAKVISDNSEEGQLLKEQIGEHIARNSSVAEELKINAKDTISYATDQRTARMPVGQKFLEMIGAINEGNFDKAIEKGIGGLKQFIAGSDMPENHTILSDLVYFPLHRLNNELEGNYTIPFTKKKLLIDLGLKGKDAASTKSLLKAWATKRIGAVMAGYYAIDALDDLSKASTGMGVTEAGVSGLANSYLGIKRITGALGLDESLKSLSQDNAIANYFGEYSGEPDGEWNTYEEQVDYYRNGYTPIRKARFWSFGSSNEFRGGRISYFEPNMLRTLASDYKDMSLYNGSYWNKWNPLNRLDPYYLENLHSEDRPYPVSGSMFEERTPWGIVLNPTIGAILKPKNKLHSDRLSSDGVDVKALIMHMNNQIRDKANQNDNLFYIQNGKLRSMDFMAYNAPTYSDRIITMDTEDETVQYNDYGMYNTPEAIQNGLYQEMSANNQKFIEQNKKLTVKDKIAIEAAKGNPIAKMATMMTGSSLNIIRNENNRILAQAGYDKSQGIMVENKLSAINNDPLENLLSDSEYITELMQSGTTNDYIHEMAVSTRMITGLYGWGVSKALGVGQNNEDRIATSADMTSFSRAFWDMNLGGAGEGYMEIARRFIPEYRRFQTKNPLVNTMPDWIPERLRFGDPYASIPNGEARLPGYGYESLNRLHPDEYGDYGAYDRFKILADVAPYSPEYKFWKTVAGKTVQDPYLRQDMERIKERVRLRNKQHDFQEYKYVGRDTDRRNAYITEIGKNGQFKIFGSNATYKLAGAKIIGNGQESQEEILERYLKPGQMVSIIVDTNEAYARNNDVNRTINAAVLIDGEDVASMMKKNGDAYNRKGDTSAAAVVARHGTIVNLLNSAAERIMHADIPVIHNRWLRANTALEDYQDEYLYGTSFQSWDELYDSFILPNMQKAANSTGWVAWGIAADIARNNLIGDTEHNLISDIFEISIKKDGPLSRFIDLQKLSENHRTAINRIQYMTDRGSLMGYLTGKYLKLGRSGSATLSQTKFRRAGNAITLGFAAAMAPENAAVSVMSMSRLGYLAANEFMGGGKYRLAAAVGGAALGLARWAGSQTLLSDDPTANTYIPEAARKRWELQDYFDRLTYIKYMALYEKAADKALSKEDVDIKAILTRQHEEAKNIKETKNEIMQDLREMSDRTDADAAKMRELLVQRMKQLQPSRVPMAGGDYTKSAIMYYNAAQATMYALNKTSSMTDVIRALPKTDREYFMEFVKEKDEDKRREIMSQVSPQIRKALNMFWYKKFDEPESNEEFFTKHAMPGPTWAGWNPNIDLADVQTKVIKNEGMQFSDFGIYASQYREPDVINAPNLDYGARDSLIESSLKMTALLNGLGFVGVNVNVEPSNDSTIQVVANVARVTEYKLEETISNIFGGI